MGEGTSLLGVSLLWWARLGKIIQFAAALTILAEIVGPERLRAFGKVLRDVSFFKLWRDMFENQSNTGPAFLVYVLLVLLIAIVMTPYIAEHWFKPYLLTIPLINQPLPQTDPQYVVKVRQAWLYSAVTSFLLSNVVLGAATEVFARFSDWLVKGFAWVLGEPNLEKKVKIASLILLFLGFSLDDLLMKG